MRGKTITTFVAYETLKRLGDLADGEKLEVLTDAREEIDNDIHAWCRTRGQELAAAGRAGGSQQYVITKRPLRASGKRLAAVISDAGLEELLSPLAFALAAALEGSDVSLYFQGPAVRVLATGFTEHLKGPALQPVRSGRARQGRSRPGPGEGPPAAGAWRPSVCLRGVDAALQGGQDRSGLRRRDHCGVPDLHGDHGAR
jgi:TusA-related sulfurtransferase